MPTEKDGGGHGNGPASYLRRELERAEDRDLRARGFQNWEALTESLYRPDKCLYLEVISLDGKPVIRFFDGPEALMDIRWCEESCSPMIFESVLGEPE